MMKLSSILIVVLAACGGAGQGPAHSTAEPVANAAPTAAPKPAAAGGALEFGEVTIRQGKEVAIKLHRDGTTEVKFAGSSDWMPSFSMQPDGTVLEQGATIAKLQADGTLAGFAQASRKQCQVTADAVTITDANDKSTLTKMVLAPNGSVHISFAGLDSTENFAPVAIAGAVTPAQRRAVMLALAAINLQESYPIWQMP